MHLETAQSDVHQSHVTYVHFSFFLAITWPETALGRGTEADTLHFLTWVPWTGHLVPLSWCVHSENGNGDADPAMAGLDVIEAYKGPSGEPGMWKALGKWLLRSLFLKNGSQCPLPNVTCV